MSTKKTDEAAAKAKVLLVEDEEHLARLLRLNLEREGYEVTSTASGSRALELQASERFDLIILDLMIEGVDGFEVVRQVRQRDARLPVLILTARSAEQDRVRGLELGADDYMVKPFHLPEFLLRVGRMLQRGSWYDDRGRRAREIRVGDYSVEMENLRGSGPRGPFQLTLLEAKLLEVLTSEPERAMPRAELLERVWGYRMDVESRTVDNFILRLRKHFEREPDSPEHFVSVRGRGYMFVE